MAYEIIGTVYKVGTTEQIPTKTGGALLKRSIILEQQRFDPNTGEPFANNYPSFEFTNQGCAQLDRYTKGSKVRLRFDIQGVLYNDKQTNEEKSFTHLRAFKIEPYVPQQQGGYQNGAMNGTAQNGGARMQQGYQQAPQGGYQQQGYQQQPPQNMPPLGYPPKQGDDLPY